MSNKNKKMVKSAAVTMMDVFRSFNHVQQKVIFYLTGLAKEHQGEDPEKFINDHLDDGGFILVRDVIQDFNKDQLKVLGYLVEQALKEESDGIHET